MDLESEQYHELIHISRVSLVFCPMFKAVTENKSHVLFVSLYHELPSVSLNLNQVQNQQTWVLNTPSRESIRKTLTFWGEKTYVDYCFLT